MSHSGLTDEELTGLYEVFKAPRGLERLQAAFEEVAPWFEGYLEGLRTAVVEVARVKQGGLEPEQQERIQRMGNWANLRDLIVDLASAQNASTARALIDAVPLPVR